MADIDINCDVHHITPYSFTQDNSLSNLITLCDVHHRLEEIHYQKWKHVSPWLSNHLKTTGVSL